MKFAQSFYRELKLKNMNVSIFFSGVLVFLTLNCKKNTHSSDDRLVEKSLRKLREETFLFDIPTMNGGKEFSTDYVQIKESVESLKLKHLERGTDSIEIRFWFNYGNDQQCLRIYHDKKRWNGELITAINTPPLDSLSQWTVSTNGVEKNRRVDGMTF